MPQFDFYISDQERSELIDYILMQGAEMIPDLLYEKDEYTKLTNSSEFFGYLEMGKVRFFIYDQSFAREPLVLSRNRFIQEPRYSIYQRKGGPHISTAFYLGHADDAIMPYKCSTVDYYVRYIHYDSYEEFLAPEELKGYYKDLVNHIKGMCKQVTRDKKKFWVGKRVLEENPSLLA